MKKTIRVSFSILLCCALMTNLIYAASTSNTISENGTGEKGEYSAFWPKSVTLETTHYSQYTNTKMSFTYGTKAINTLNTYRNIELYPGVEIRDYSKSAYDNFSAYSIATNLPDPKKDLENDDIFGTRNEEAEVTVLGTLTANKNYYISANWTDYRSNDGEPEEVLGNFAGKAELSEKGLSDYNVVDYKYLHVDVNYFPPQSRNTAASSLNGMSTIVHDSSSECTPITLTFNNYLSFDEIENLQRETAIPMGYLQLRGFAEDGERITIYSHTYKGLDETKALLIEQANNEKYTIQGITAIYTYADKDQINELKKCESTYSIQLPEEFNHSTEIDTLDEQFLNSKFAHPSTWKLENENILK